VAIILLLQHAIIEKSKYKQASFNAFVILITYNGCNRKRN